MVEDEGGQGQRLLLESEAELLAECVLQTEAGDRCRFSIAGLLRLGDCRGGLKAGVAYDFRVYAVNAAGLGTPTAVLTAQT